MLDRESPIPLYHQLAQSLARDIRDNVLAEGERIPSEHELAAQHNIGRPTVRQAIDSLVRKGMLVRKRGSGTFVAPRQERLNLFSLAGTSASFNESGRAPEVRIVDQPARRWIPAVRDASKAAPGNGANPFAGHRAFFFSRVSSMENEPVLVEDIWLSFALFPDFDAVDMTGRSLSRLVEEHYQRTLTRGEQHFRIAYPDKRLSGLLDIPRSTPILAVDRFLHFGAAENAIFAQLFCRTDRFVFTQTLGGHPHA